MCLRLIAEIDARSVGDSHPSCKNRVQNNVASGRAEFLGVIPPLVTFWGTLLANEVLKMSNLGGKKAVWAPVPLLAIRACEEYCMIII